MLSLRFILDPPQNRFLNMAIDEALLRLCQRPTLRIYRWSEPNAISIGYFQKKDDVPEKRPFVRRYTGGGLVDHENDFTYSVIVPKTHSFGTMGTSESYRTIHEALLEALLREGYDAQLAACCAKTENSACFQKPVKFDIISTSNQQKLAGAAQRRTRQGSLHQGSILIQNFDFNSLATSVAKELSKKMKETLKDPEKISDEEMELALELRKTRYATDAWNNSK